MSIFTIFSTFLFKKIQQFLKNNLVTLGAFRRVHQNEEEVTIVKQMPRGVERAMQPTIAVITAQYFEKMAVDAMMINKQTFMRYATVG